MPILEEAVGGPPNLATSREPVSPTKRNKDDRSVGSQALNDALIIVGVSWVVLLLLAYSLRSHNV